MNSASVEVSQWYESLKEKKLEENENSAGIWLKYKNDLEVTKSLLSLLPKKISHNVMVPIGPKALMPGKIVHTNEFLVNLGETWFIKSTGPQTEEICNRRIATCNDMLQKLEKEREIIVNKNTLPAQQDAFGSEERPEIIEYVTEEENEEWKKLHKQKEREYRQKLAELRNKEKKPIDTEEDLWKHLDELELQEELEDELNRLNEELSSDDDTSESDTSEMKSTSDIQVPISSSVKTSEPMKDNNEDLTPNSDSLEKSNIKKRRVSFACDLDSSDDDEPLQLYITHSDVECSESNENSLYINSPKDIYDRYIKNVAGTTVPVLKVKVNLNKEKEFEKAEREKTLDTDEFSDETNTENILQKTSIAFNDITERNPYVQKSAQNNEEKKKRLSKFRASRTKVS